MVAEEDVVREEWLLQKKAHSLNFDCCFIVILAGRPLLSSMFGVDNIHVYNVLLCHCVPPSSCGNRTQFTNCVKGYIHVV